MEQFRFDENLRIADVHSDDGYLFIKDSKGKKDRKTILPEQLLVLLRTYYKAYKPSYWLFEDKQVANTVRVAYDLYLEKP